MPIPRLEQTRGAVIGRAVAVMVLAFSIQVSGGDESGTGTLEWVGGGSAVLVIDQMVLFETRQEGFYRVCPLVPDLKRQPFCRRFESAMLGACKNGGEVFIVLANGELHHVNNALIGVDGGYEPVFRPDEPLQLDSVWLPYKNCRFQAHLPEVFAISQGHSVLHFTGEQWEPVH